MDRESILEAAIKAGVAGGNLLMEYYTDTFNISVGDSLRDVFTEVDKMADRRIIKILKDYDKAIPIISEESRPMRKDKKEAYWIVDALDGTVNYINRIPFFCVSVAFIEKGKPAVGIVYNPMAGHLYYGAEGLGVFKNQKRIKARDKLPQQGLFSVAFSGKKYDAAKRKEEFLLFGEINDQSRGCLRTGSAAMNLAYLSEGNLSGCWGRANKFWDVAAGLLLAKLSGAKVKFKKVNEQKHLVNYLAAVPSAWDFVNEKTKLF